MQRDYAPKEQFADPSNAPALAHSLHVLLMRLLGSTVALIAPIIAFITARKKATTRNWNDSRWRDDMRECDFVRRLLF